MKNEFAELLHDLISKSGVKNINISNAVGYDLSYISKWLSGKFLPSDKSIDDVSLSIAHCIADGVDSQNGLFNEYGVVAKQELEKAISQQLKIAYKKSKEKNTVEKEKVPIFYLEMRVRDAIHYLDKYNEDKSDIAVIVDFFDMNREDRLLFLGIQNGNFVRTEYNPSVNFTMIVNVDEESEDIIYDALSIIHMVSSFSLYNFRLYNCSLAKQKVCFSVLNDRALIGTVLGDERGLSFVTVTENVNSIDAVYKKIISLTKQGCIVFRKQTMANFVYSQEYIKSMFSTNVKWIIGHITEMLLPDDLFMELLLQICSNDSEEMVKIHKLSSQLIWQRNTRIILYETAISDMLATGFVDFFNNRIHLSKTQKIACLDYLMGIMNGNNNIKMIESGFTIDFQHVYSPCVFISDSCTYLRLEEAYNRENILFCLNQKIKNLFNSFYDEAWSNKEDIVVSDKTIILKKLTHYKAVTKMMESIE